METKFREKADKDPGLKGVIERAKEIRDYQIGYPFNMDADLKDYYEWYYENHIYEAALNNAGDPFDSPMRLGDHNIELKVLEWFAPKYGFEEGKYWGIVSNSGTDGNSHGIYFGRNFLTKKTGQKPIMYVSNESHYSNIRLADLQGIEFRLIKTDRIGRMIPEDFEKQIDATRPALVVYSMGSTFLGAIDDQKAINEIIENANFPAVYRHVDAALFGGYFPFSDHKDLVDRRIYHFDSIAISGHKFFGVDEPCGVFLTTKEVFNNQKEFNSLYLNGNMSMINCSRSATNAIKLYWLINKYGEENYKKQVKEMFDNTRYLVSELKKIGYGSLNDSYKEAALSNTVVFRRPSERIMEKYHLAAGHDEVHGDNCHIIVMQNVTKERIDQLINDIKEENK